MCADANSDCDHLFQGGAVDTIVRLPDDVGFTDPSVHAVCADQRLAVCHISAVRCPLRA